MAVECLSWWPLSPWLSPAAAWFIFFNAVVGAIAVMSRVQQGGGGGQASLSQRRLCRSASSTVLDRLRSFSIFPVHPAASGGCGGVTAPTLHVDSAVSESRYYNCSCEAEEAPAPQVRRVAPALEPGRPSPLVTWETETTACIAPPRPSAPVATEPAEHDAASAPEREEDKAKAEVQDKPISLDEAYALAQHRRPQQSPSPTASATAAAAATAVATAAAARSMKREPAKATKRRPQARGGREAEEAVEGKAEVNARAERFIRQFREELKLQRLNSILNHTHALGTRASEGSPTVAP